MPTFWFPVPSSWEVGMYFAPWGLERFFDILLIIFNNPFNNEQDWMAGLRLSFLTYIISHLHGPAELKIPCQHNALILDSLAMCLRGSRNTPSIITLVPGKKQRLREGKLRQEMSISSCPSLAPSPEKKETIPESWKQLCSIQKSEQLRSCHCRFARS